MTDTDIEKALIEIYPIFRRSQNQSVYEILGTCCGWGWLTLLINFAEKIRSLRVADEHLAIREISEVNESLRIDFEAIYTAREHDEEITLYLQELEDKSFFICQRCGEPIARDRFVSIDPVSMKRHTCKATKITNEYHCQVIAQNQGASK